MQPALFPAHPPPQHRTARERRAHSSAQAAIARAQAHAHQPPADATPDQPDPATYQRRTRPDDDQADDETIGRLYPYVTPARATAIRHAIEEDNHHA